MRLKRAIQDPFVRSCVEQIYASPRPNRSKQSDVIWFDASWKRVNGKLNSHNPYLNGFLVPDHDTTAAFVYYPLHWVPALGKAGRQPKAPSVTYCSPSILWSERKVTVKIPCCKCMHVACVCKKCRMHAVFSFNFRTWNSMMEFTSCSTSRILLGKQEETLNKSLCAKMVKHSAFHATFIFNQTKKNAV